MILPSFSSRPPFNGRTGHKERVSPNAPLSCSGVRFEQQGVMSWIKKEIV
jgi:hypothetical protein